MSEPLEESVETILLLDEEAWREFELAGGISFSRKESGLPGAYYYDLEMIVTLPMERRKKTKKGMKIRRDLDNFLLTVRKAYRGNELDFHELRITPLDDVKWKAAKYPYKHFSERFFKNFEQTSSRVFRFNSNSNVSPAEVFDLIYGIFDYYLDAEKEKLILFTIYTIGTYFYKLFPTFPYLYLFGAMESGKTKTLSIFEKLCFNGIASVNLSVSALFRLIEVFGATLCIDESEYLRDSEKRSELQSLLFSGYKKDSGSVLRVEGDKVKNVRVFRVYSPKIMASINYPHDVLLSRCIIVNMRRGTNIEKLNRTVSDELVNMRDKIYLMAFNKFDELYQMKDMDFTELPKQQYLVGREHELWRPLLVIMYWLKGYMPDRAKELEEAIMEMLEQDVMLKQSLRIDSDLITIIYCLLSNVHESGFLTLQTIRDFILDEYRENDLDYKNMSRYWTPERIGRQLSSMGFKRSRQRGRTYYYIDLNRLKELAEAYGVNIDSLEETSTSSTSSTQSRLHGISE